MCDGERALSLDHLSKCVDVIRPFPAEKERFGSHYLQVVAKLFCRIRVGTHNKERVSSSSEECADEQSFQRARDPVDCACLTGAGDRSPGKQAGGYLSVRSFGLNENSIPFRRRREPGNRRGGLFISVIAPL